MSDFIDTLLARSLNRAESILPRTPSLYEAWPDGGPAMAEPQMEEAATFSPPTSRPIAGPLPPEASGENLTHQAPNFVPSPIPDRRAAAPIGEQVDAPNPVTASPSSARSAPEATSEASAPIESVKSAMPTPQQTTTTSLSPVTEAERPDPIDGIDTSRDIHPLPAPDQALPAEQPDAVQPLLPRPESEQSLPRQLPTSNVVKVSIGRIEVRASQPAVQAKPEFARLRPRAKFQPRMGLSDYMAKKRGNR